MALFGWIRLSLRHTTHLQRHEVSLAGCLMLPCHSMVLDEFERMVRRPFGDMLACSSLAILALDEPLDCDRFSPGALH
jgi:hypothetical protein